MLQCVAVCCRVLQPVAVCCSLLQCGAACSSVFQDVEDSVCVVRDSLLAPLILTHAP